MNSTSSLYTLSLDFNPLLNLSSSDTQSDEESKKAENTTTTTHRLGTLLHRVLEPHICFLFLVPSDYLTHADFCIFGYLDCKQQASLRVKIAWQRSQAQTETCGTSVPHNYFDMFICTFAPSPPFIPLFPRLCFISKRDIGGSVLLFLSCLAFPGPSLPLIDLCRPLGPLNQTPDWLLSLHLISLTRHMCWVFLSTHTSCMCICQHNIIYLYMGESFCTSSPALAWRYTCVDVMCDCHSRFSKGPVQGSREHAVPSFTATPPQLAARFTAVCVGVSVCV